MSLGLFLRNFYIFLLICVKFRRTQEAKQVLEQRANPQSVYIKRENLPINEVINVCPVMNTAPVQGQTTFAPIQVHSGGPGETKPTTKYVSYMQVKTDYLI